MAELHLFTDADNTLWDTNAVFAKAQLDLLHGIEDRIGQRRRPGEMDALAFLRNIDQRIAAAHPEGLRYPAAILARGLVQALRHDTVDIDSLIADSDAGGADCFGDLLRAYESTIVQPPVLRPGVRSGLIGARQLTAAICVVTETSAKRCSMLLTHHDLLPYVDRVHAEPKTPQLYADLRSDGALNVMVGDQLDRDVGFPQESGYLGILFSGSFRPFWELDATARADYTISRFDELVPILSKLGSSRTRSQGTVP